MRATLRTKCARRTIRRAPEPQPIEAWAASVIADPAAHCATEREAAIVATLLAQLAGTR